MAMRIRIEHGQDAGKVLRLGEPGTYRFGRSPQGSGQVLDMKVSKEHFEIIVSADGALLRDLGSSHGTLLNGQIVPKDSKPLVPGDEIRVGLTVMRAMSDGPADAELKAVAPMPSASSAGAASLAASSMRANGGSSAPAAGAGVGKPVAKALPPDALVGTTLSGYRILEKVGAGGMGSVYRAEQLSLHREVAIKVLAEKLVSDSAFVDQFVNEARAAGQLNHPNVVQVYDVGQVDGRHFFSMEFIHGGSVEGKIPKTGGGVPWQDALNWFLDGANALIFAEQKGILHRDIKPDNFMVGQEGSVKLCDLGLAKKSESADLLAQGIIGTPHFIAPEAIRRKTDVDQRADLYSLGCTFYRVLTGKNPYPGASVKEILLAHLNAPVPRPSALATDVPKELDDIVVKLMAKDPAQRFQNADDLWEALDKVRLQHGLEAHGFHPGRTKKLLYAAVALLVGAVGALFYFKPWEDRTVTITKVGDTKYVGDPEADRKMRESQALATFSNLKSDISERLGKPDQGDAWKRKKEWDEAIANVRKLATDEKFKDTPATGEASKYADDLQSRWNKYHDKMERLQGAIKAAEDALDKTREDAIKTVNDAINAKDWFGAMRAASAGLTAVEEARAKNVDGTVLLDAKRVDAAKTVFENLAKMVLGEATKEFNAFPDAARIRLDASSTPEQLVALDAELTKWLGDHELPEGGQDERLVTMLTSARNAVTAMREEIAKLRAAGQREGLIADRAAYFALLIKLFTPLDDLGQGGGAFAAMRLGEAVKKSSEVIAKTEPFKILALMRAHEARLIVGLPDVLASRFKEKGWKDKVSGRGWSGVPKEFKSDGIVVGDKVHLYADEGPGFLLDLFYVEKGADRFPPMTADEHEALGALAEATGIVEADGAKRFDLALSEFAKAEASEPARAARLAGRRALVEAEKSAKFLIEASGRKVDETNTALDELAEQLGSSLNDAKKFEDAKKKIAGAEAAWREAMKVAAQDLKDVLVKYPSTIVRALLGSTVPDDANYGVDIPPAPTRPAGPPAMPPAVPGAVPPVAPPQPNGTVLPQVPPPAMDGAPGGMNGAPPAPGIDPPPPAKDVAGMDGRPK